MLNHKVDVTNRINRHEPLILSVDNSPYDVMRALLILDTSF